MKKLVNLHCPHQVLATQTNFSSSSKHGVFTTLINDDLMIINYHDERKEGGEW